MKIIQKSIIVGLALKIKIKFLVMIIVIKVIIKVVFYSFYFFKPSLLLLWVNEVQLLRFSDHCSIYSK